MAFRIADLPRDIPRLNTWIDFIEELVFEHASKVNGLLFREGEVQDILAALYE